MEPVISLKKSMISHIDLNADGGPRRWIEAEKRGSGFALEVLVTRSDRANEVVSRIGLTPAEEPRFSTALAVQ